MDKVNKNIDELLVIARENNEMLKYIVNYITSIIVTADKENMDDFARNVLANIISGGNRK